MFALGSVGIGLRCFLPGASTTPPLRPLVFLSAAVVAGFLLEPFVAPPASCSSSSAAPSRTLAICLVSASRSSQPSAFA